MTDGDDLWLARIKRLRAIAQTGLAYSQDPYDRERFDEVRDISHELLAALTDTPPRVITNLFLPERGYPTPKVDVRAGVFRDDEILLVRESADGLWTLPGGWGDEHDSPGGNVEREVLEESGYQVRAARLVAVKDRHLHPYEPRRVERIYKLFFLCDLTGGEPRASLETSAVDWFAPHQLPPLSLGRTLPEDVQMLADCRHKPELPVYFD